MLQVQTNQGNQASFILHLEDNLIELVLCSVQYLGQVTVHQVSCVQYSTWAR